MFDIGQILVAFAAGYALKSYGGFSAAATAIWAWAWAWAKDKAK